MKAIPPAAIVIGLLFLVASAVWPVMFPATRTWTDAKSRRLKEIGAEEQALVGKIEYLRHRPSMTSGENPAVMKERAEVLRAEREALQADLTAATEGPAMAKAILKWTGISVLVLGVIGHLAAKDA